MGQAKGNKSGGARGRDSAVQRACRSCGRKSMCSNVYVKPTAERSICFGCNKHFSRKGYVNSIGRILNATTSRAFKREARSPRTVFYERSSFYGNRETTLIIYNKLSVVGCTVRVRS